jgi:hypothetical protein
MPNVTEISTKETLVSDEDHAGGNEDSSRKGESFVRDEGPQLPPIKKPGLMFQKPKPKKSPVEEQKLPHSPSTKSITVSLHLGSRLNRRKASCRPTSKSQLSITSEIAHIEMQINHSVA